jgi:hypothetical protein
MITIHQENRLSFLQPRETRPYPSDNSSCFEEWFLDNYQSERNKSDRVYLPILATELNKRIKKDRRLARAVDDYFRHLDRKHKYFIIVQHDDGIKFNTWGIDLKVFGMGCKGDVQLPLVCQPHKYEFKETGRPIFASFIGSITHPIREQMVKELQGKEGYFISTEHTSLHSYCYIISQSKFVLCPRGYGATSFRIQEALQYGAQPIYISDNYLMGNYYNGSVARDVHDAVFLMSKEYNQTDCSGQMKALFNKYYTFSAVANMIYENL